MDLHYNGRIFRGRSNTGNGDVGSETIFYYRQEGDVVSATYTGGVVRDGQLLGTVADDGSLDFCYHHIDSDGALHAGQCRSTPRVEKGGRLVLEEEWQWLTGDRSRGSSVVEEVEVP
ncbi:MAG: n-acetylglutamate synthase [Acidobacteriota bacterium]